MTQLTVRGVDAMLHQTLKRKAAENGMSVNKYIVSILKEKVDVSPRQKSPKTHEDLEWFFGAWTAEETEEFDKALEWSSQVEPEMWE